MMSRPLGKNEGKQEVASTVKVTRTGDGLSNALEADPRGWDVGDRVPVLMWTEVEDVNHKRAKEGKGVVRKHNFVCTEMVVLDFLADDEIEAMFEAQREAVKAFEAEQERLAEEAAGVQRVPFPGDSDGEPKADGETPPNPDAGLSDAQWQASAKEEATPPISRRRGGRKPKDDAADPDAGAGAEVPADA